MMRYAYAYLDIKPADFWDLTLAEYNVMMEGYKIREYKEREKNAEHALWVMSPHVGKKGKLPTIEKLIGKHPEDKEEDKSDKPVTTKTDLEDIKNQFKKGG